MRELNECKREILWRSQNRIHRRKQVRKRVLACCIPLVLCITVLASTAFIQQGPVMDGGGGRKNWFGKPSDHMSGQPNTDSTAVGVTVFGFGVRKNIKDPVQTAQLYDRLRALVKTGTPATDLDGPSSGGDLTDGIPAAKYSIVFFGIGTDGSYTLTGNVLSCDQTGQTVVLTNTQLKELKTLLGLNK